MTIIYQLNMDFAKKKKILNASENLPVVSEMTQQVLTVRQDGLSSINRTDMADKGQKPFPRVVL